MQACQVWVFTLDVWYCLSTYSYCWWTLLLAFMGEINKIKNQVEHHLRVLLVWSQAASSKYSCACIRNTARMQRDPITQGTAQRRLGDVLGSHTGYSYNFLFFPHFIPFTNLTVDVCNSVVTKHCLGKGRRFQKKTLGRWLAEPSDWSSFSLGRWTLGSHDLRWFCESTCHSCALPYFSSL